MEIIDHWHVRTHQPLIQCMLSVFKPELIVELGTGVNSTPLFLQYSPKELICIENDQEWFKYMKKFFTPEKAEYQIMYHQPEPIHISHYTEKEQEGSEKYYLDLKTYISERFYSPRLLFVDQVLGLRALSIRTLHSQFDIIIYHDCQPAGTLLNDYHFKDIINAGFEFYILKNDGVWTGVLLHRNLQYTEMQLKRVIASYIDTFQEVNGFCSMYLEKQ